MAITEPTVSFHAVTSSASTAVKSTARLSTGVYTSCTHTASSGTAHPTSGAADCVVTNLLDNYQLQSVISKATTAISTSEGLVGVTPVAGLGQTWKLSALSVHDFNIFRKLVAEAINTLDKKIEDILKVTAPTC